MNKAVCLESCQGDNGFIFKKDKEYKIVENKDIIVIVEDDFGNKNLFYKNEFNNLFKLLN